MARQRYGSIHARFWLSAKRQGWSDREKLLAAYLLTGPHCTIAGAMYLPIAYMAADLGWQSDDCQETLSRLSGHGFATFDPASEWCLVNNRLRYDPPDNPNAFKGVLAVLAEMPTTHPGWATLVPILEEIGRRFRMKTTLPQPSGNGSETVPEPSAVGQPQPQPQPQPISKSLSTEPESESTSSSSSARTRARGDRSASPPGMTMTTTDSVDDPKPGTEDIFAQIRLAMPRDEVAQVLGFNGAELDRQVTLWARLVPAGRIDEALAAAAGRQGLRDPRAYVDKVIRAAAQEASATAKGEGGGQQGGNLGVEPPPGLSPEQRAAFAAFDPGKQIPLKVMLTGARIEDGVLHPLTAASRSTLERGYLGELARMGLQLAPPGALK